MRGNEDPFAIAITRVAEADEQAGRPVARSQWAPEGCTCPWPAPLDGVHLRITCPRYLAPEPPRIAVTLEGCHRTGGTWIHGRPHTCPAYLRGRR